MESMIELVCVFGTLSALHIADSICLGVGSGERPTIVRRRSPVSKNRMEEVQGPGVQPLGLWHLFRRVNGDGR
jgi:hypothetical protein